MQYVYQVKNTITIDKEYYYKINNLKYHKYAKQENYAVCVLSEEYHYY